MRTHPFLFFLSHSCEVFCYLFVAGFVYSLDEKHSIFFFWNRVLLLSCTSAVHRWVSIPCTNFPRMPRMKWEPVDMKSVSTHDILTHKNAPSSQPAYVIRVSVSCVNKRKKRHFKNKSHSKSKKRRRRRKYSMLLENYNSVRWKQKGLGCIMRCKLGWWACGRVCVCVFTVLSPPLLELWWPKNGSQWVNAIVWFLLQKKAESQCEVDASSSKIVVVQWPVS